MSMNEQERAVFLSLLHKEVVPALGCTEPIAVALCAARAAEELGETPEKLDVAVSANLLKNGMGVMKWDSAWRRPRERSAAEAPSGWNA